MTLHGPEGGNKVAQAIDRPAMPVASTPASIDSAPLILAALKYGAGT